ncbi:hypothetical protein [Pseudomonas protegens]|nr:hypothetical protein [Pseudomonas protegens]
MSKPLSEDVTRQMGRDSCEQPGQAPMRNNQLPDTTPVIPG